MQPATPTELTSDICQTLKTMKPQRNMMSRLKPIKKSVLYLGAFYSKRSRSKATRRTTGSMKVHTVKLITKRMKPMTKAVVKVDFKSSPVGVPSGFAAEEFMHD